MVCFSDTLLRRVEQAPDRSGSLRELMARLNDADDEFRGDTEMRCLPDRLAHLRLARLCVEAQRAE